MSRSCKRIDSQRTASRACSGRKRNVALGELIGHYRDTLTEYCYFFAMFGTPSPTEP